MIEEAVNEAASQFVGSVSVLSTATTSRALVKQAIISAFNNGTSHVSFLGHGSITQWGQLSGVLDTSDLESLLPARPSIVAAYNCLSGYFQHPTIQAIGEELVRLPEGGAVPEAA